MIFGHFVAEGGTLLPRIPYEEGFHRLVVRIDQIGLKDAHVYMNPFFTISVKGNVQQFDPVYDTCVRNLNKDLQVLVTKTSLLQPIFTTNKLLLKITW